MEKWAGGHFSLTFYFHPVLRTQIFILGCFVMNHKTILLTCRFILSTLSRQSHVACSYLKMGYFLDYFHLVVVGFP